jgi:internalin A
VLACFPSTWTPVGEFPLPADIMFYGTFTLTTVSGDTLGLDSILVEQPAASVRILPAADREVVFPDGVLDRHIRQLDSIPTGEPIMLSEVIGHTYLNFAQLGVQNLAGIENLINLTYIYMNLNPTGSTISYLSNLPALASLYAEDNAITNIGPLANLTQMEDLDLDLNFITDISPLAGMSRLSYLYGEPDQRSVAFVTRSHLQGLYLGANQIGDLTPLRGLTGCTIWTFSNQIADAPLISNCRLGILTTSNCGTTRLGY